VVVAILLNARAEQLPTRIYTIADGLPRDSVFHIKQDSRGFLWVFTGEGLTRFDGYTFRNYTTDEGLADRRVNDLLETRAGSYGSQPTVDYVVSTRRRNRRRSGMKKP
jgi:ligand-binding sensor domain-containing protein